MYAKIIDEEGKECPPGVTGRLLIKACYGTMYWRNPERQKEAVIDGWSLSGDFAYKDEDGLFWHVSRIDDIIKSRGYRVSPGEVEDALNEHPAIYESTVIGVPDPEQGQRVKAFAVLKGWLHRIAGTRRGDTGLGQEAGGPLHGPERDRVRGIAAQDRDRQSPPGGASGPGGQAGGGARGPGRGRRGASQRRWAEPRMNVPAFTYLRAASLADACALLAEHGSDAKILAGGTDVLVKMKHRRLTPSYLVNIKGIPDLDYITYERGQGLRVGPLATIESVKHSVPVRKWYPVLHQAAAYMATVAIRNRATLVGNICNGSPSAETAPALIVLGAQARVAGPGGERMVPVEDFFAGPGSHDPWARGDRGRDTGPRAAGS